MRTVYIYNYYGRVKQQYRSETASCHQVLLKQINKLRSSYETEYGFTESDVDSGLR